jgi:hypothetical protein
MAELDALDRDHGLGTMPDGQPPRGRRARRERRPSSGVLPGLLVTALVLGGLVLVSPSHEMQRLRALFGFGGERLGRVPDVPTGVGHFKFSMTQPGSDDPVGYDPCRPIQVIVNPEGAPDDWQELVDTAIAHTEAATGLEFDDLGETEDRDFTRGHGFAVRRPVLVAWSDEDEFAELAGDVAGVGGSSALKVSPDHVEYVTGIVVLDTEVFTDDADPAEMQAIVDHEFGHVVGLDHVHDPRELMNQENVGLTTYGPGDREGLARLGAIDC